MQSYFQRTQQGMPKRVPPTVEQVFVDDKKCHYLLGLNSHYYVVKKNVSLKQKRMIKKKILGNSLLFFWMTLNTAVRENIIGIEESLALPEGKCASGFPKNFTLLC